MIPTCKSALFQNNRTLSKKRVFLWHLPRFMTLPFFTYNFDTSKYTMLLMSTLTARNFCSEIHGLWNYSVTCYEKIRLCFLCAVMTYWLLFSELKKTDIMRLFWLGCISFSFAVDDLLNQLHRCVSKYTDGSIEQQVRRYREKNLLVFKEARKRPVCETEHGKMSLRLDTMGVERIFSRGGGSSECFQRVAIDFPRVGGKWWNFDLPTRN